MGKLCVRMSSQAVGNSLFALGRMGLRFEDLSESSRVALEIAVRHSMDLAHDQDFMQIVQGLALMQVPWTTLSVQTRHSLSMTLFTRAKTWLQRGSFGSVVEYATLLQSLGGLGVRWTDCDPALRAGLLLGLTAVTDLSGGANSTDPAAAHLSSDKDSFVKIEKLKYGVLQNLASRALNNTRSSNLSGNVDQTMESTTTNQLPVPASDSPHTDSELRYVYALAIPNIWRSLADLEISLVEDASAQVNEQLSSRVAVSSIPAPISRRFFTLTAVFASDFSLQGLSMLSTSLISLSVNSKSSSSSSVKRKPNMIPRVLSEELTKRLILLLEQHVQSSADIVDEESQRSVANIVTCAGKLEFLQFEERNMKKRFQTNLQLFYERQYKHHLNYSIGENTTDLILVPLAVESSVSTTRNLESILATLNGVVAMKSKYNWENAPLELKQATWSGLSDCLQSARSASLSKQLIVELELAASIICTLGNLGVDWKSLMSHVSFVRSRRLRQQPTITQEQTDISQTTHSSEIPLLLSLVETCQDIVERYLSTNLNSSEGQEEASRLVVLLLRALNGIGYLGNTVDATNNTVNAINNIRSLPTTSDLVMLLLKVFTTNRSDDVGLFTSALYHLGKIQSQAFESEPLPQAQMSKLTSLASQLLIRHFDKISYQVLANVFTGLKGLRVRWDVLPHSLQSVCLVRLAYLAATQLTGEGSTGVVACVSALAAIDMLGSQVSRNDTNENIKAHHSLVMQSGSPPGALSNELAHSQSLRAYLHSNLHRYILRQVANTVDSFSALECRLLLRACCSLQWTTHMSKSLKLLLLQIISDEMQNSITSRLVESRKFTRRLVKYDGDLFSPLAFVKLCVDIGGISWIDLPISLRSKLLISAVDFALLKKDHPDSATYSQFRSFLHRLESLGATWTTLAGVHSSLPFERFLVTEIRRFLCSSSDYRLTNSSPPSTRRHADDSNRFEPKYDFRVATEMLDWTVRMNCRHTDFLQFESVAPGSALSDNLIQTACDAVLSIPKFALLTSQTTEKMQIEDMASEDRALIKFSALLDMLLAFDIQWLSLGQTGQRALIRLMHLAVLLALRDVGSKTTPANSVTENTSMSLFDRAVQLLFFLRIKWSDLPTRPRNLLSSALAEVMLKHQEKVIALLALQNRQVSTSMLESPEVSTVALEEAELQKTVNFLGDMVHIVQMILRHLQVSNQTATKELRQFL